MGEKMTWWEIANSLTADSSDMNDNFSELAAGSITPRSSAGASFVATNSVHDLGTTTARYNTLYSKDIHFDTINDQNGYLWKLITSFSLTSSALSYEVTGLNGDDYNEMMIICNNTFNTQTASSVYMFFNTDSGTTYNYQEVEGRGSSIFTDKGRIDYGFEVGTHNFYTKTSSFFNAICYTKTGRDRQMFAKYCKIASSTTVFSIHATSYLWVNTVDTLTSIKVISSYAQFVDGTVFQVWAR